MVETSDVVIVGGGIYGASIAYYLAKNGVKNIVILEKSGIAAGATSQSDGLIRHYYSNKILVEMAWQSTKIFSQFKETMGQSIDYVRNGLLVLAREDRESMDGQIKMQRSVGVETDVLEPHELSVFFKEYPPYASINVSDVGIGLFDRKAAYADPYKVTIGYAKRAKDYGVDIRNGVMVTGIEVENNRVVSVITNKGKIATGLVLNVAGPWAKSINDMVGLDVPIGIEPLQNAIVIPDCSFEATYPSIIDTVDMFIIKPESGGKVMIGLDEVEEGNPDTYVCNLCHDVIAKNLKNINRRFPAFKNFGYQNIYGGCDSTTPDWHPAIGYPEDGPDGYFCANGFSLHGFKISPALSEAIAQMVLKVDLKYDMSILDVNRFSRGEVIESRGSQLA